MQLLQFIKFSCTDDRVYMKIIVDPLLPSSVSTTFYGPTSSVEIYRDKYRDGISDWNSDEDIYRNFLKIFGKDSRIISIYYILYSPIFGLYFRNCCLSTKIN